MTRKQNARISTFGSRITSIISVSLVLLIIGILGMIMITGQSLGRDIRSNIGFIIKASPDATDVQVRDIRGAITASGAAESFVFSSADAILTEESELMGQPLDSLLEFNPFGAEYDVRVRPEYASGDSIAALASRFEQLEGVDEVVTEAAVVDNVNSVLDRITLILIAVGAAMLVISFVLINNTVSLAVYSRRFIIHTMKLVGATGAFIRRPFLRAGMATGAVASAVACALLAGIRVYAASADALLADILAWEYMYLIFAAIFIIGPLICLIASAIATNRYLRADYDEMFK